MIEVLLTLIILVLIGGFAWYISETNKEKAKLVNALVAKNAQELSGLTLADQTTIKPEVGNTQNPELIPTDQLNDDQFDKMIESERGEEDNG